ncbi:MAG: amidohydrolase family protein [Robiginitalea sp.]|uniref:metal-dependent hydrolase family protein n=1 Tax=Robiginitalea sp. TaxID=1902411 RepID=UPI003C70AE85
MKNSFLASLLWFISVGLFAQEKPKPITLFANVQVFDGTSDKLIKADVLVEGNLIKQISKEPLMVIQTDNVTMIDGGGRTLMPGLIDAHWHSLLATLSLAELMTNDLAYMSLKGAIANEAALMRGFTTVRDIGGNVFSIKKATDEGIINGPRIYPSGAVISQTSGHGDFRSPLTVPENPGQPLDYLQQSGMGIIADGVPAVIKRSREILRRGASQLKVMAGGGVSSNFDPLDVTQYTFAEMSALVEVANTWNTYIAVHAFTDTAVKQALEAGVKSIEHGHLLGEDVIKLMAEKGAWLSMQPILDDEDAISFPEGSPNRAKFITVTAGTDKVYGYAKKHGVKIAWGTDTLFDEGLAAKQGKQLAKMKRWFTPFEVLKMATHDNAELLALSGPRNPYQQGPLGVIKEGAYADLILVSGNPLEDLDLVADAANNFLIIMKDGKIYKNTIN